MQKPSAKAEYFDLSMFFLNSTTAKVVVLMAKSDIKAHKFTSLMPKFGSGLFWHYKCKSVVKISKKVPEGRHIYRN
jgi:hypothetical protein